MERSGFPYFDLAFDKNAKPIDPGQLAKLTEGVGDLSITDLIVMSHGWKNTITDANALYGRWLGSARLVLDEGAVDLGGRKVAFAGVLWPAAKFADASDIPGGAASLGSDTRELDQLREFFEDEVPADLPDPSTLAADPEARERFLQALRALGAAVDDDEDTSGGFYVDPTDDVFRRAVRGPKAPVGDQEGGAADVGSLSGAGDDGDAAGLGDIFRGARDAARELLNLTTYYGMKKRAGIVGAIGLQPVLSKVRAARGALKLHLVGHSFGGRLVAACADGPGHQSDLSIDSMSLLQAAFSHNGFRPAAPGQAPGFFHRVPARVRGPILITHTPNDTAVGKMYAMASRLNGDDAAGLGDASDRFGGMGRNGAQAVGPLVAKPDQLPAVKAASAYLAGRIHNLESSAFIHDHNDVCGPQVAQATLAAISIT